MIYQAAIEGATMTGRLLPGPRGPPDGGSLPTDIGPGGELWGYHEC
jgi:hypothetical protein